MSVWCCAIIVIFWGQKKNREKLRTVYCHSFGRPPLFCSHNICSYCVHCIHQSFENRWLWNQGSFKFLFVFKDRIELGDELKDGHPYDVASLIKQFFRELPDPLLTAKLHDTFLKVRKNVCLLWGNMGNFSFSHFIFFGVRIPSMKWVDEFLLNL